MGEPRTTTVDDLNEFDIGHPVRFRRLGAVGSDRPIVRGVLLKITATPYLKGTMPRPGRTLRLKYQRGINSPEWVTEHVEDHGPLPAGHPIEVLRKPARPRIVPTEPKQGSLGNLIHPDQAEALRRLTGRGFDRNPFR